MASQDTPKLPILNCPQLHRSTWHGSPGVVKDPLSRLETVSDGESRVGVFVDLWMRQTRETLVGEPSQLI